MKALEKLYDLLPIPVLVAIALLSLAGWVIKENRGYPAWGAIFRDSYFQISIIVIALCLIGYFSIKYIFDAHALQPFSKAQRGIVIAKFQNDPTSKVQLHVADALEQATLSEFPNSMIALQRAEQVIGSADQARELLTFSNAYAVLWGSFVPESAVHLKASIVPLQEGRLSIVDFPKTEKFGSQLLKTLGFSASPSDSVNERVAPLQQELAAVKVDQNRIQNDYKKLIARIEALEGRPPTVVTDFNLDQFTRAKKRAVVVGLNSYNTSSLPRLQFSAGDAREMSALLQQAGYEVAALVDAGATHRAIREKLSEAVARSQRGDIIVFYFAGHGFTQGGNDFIIPFDGAGDSLSQSAIDVQNISAYFRSLDGVRTAILLDSGSSIVPSNPSRFSEPFLPLEMAGRPTESGIHVIMAATGRGELSYEDARLGHGLFTNYLLRGLSGEADLDGMGYVTFDELSRFVQARMAGAAEGQGGPRQRPVAYVEGDRPEKFILSSFRK